MGALVNSTQVNWLLGLLLFVVVAKLILSFTKISYDGEPRLIRAKNLAIYIGFIIMSVSTICLYTIFFKAYLSPDKTTLVMINMFGEANAELVILSLVAPCICYFFYHIRKYRKNLSVAWKNEVIDK